MQSKEIQRWQDQSALERYGLIAPLLDDALDTAAKTKLRGEISKKVVSPHERSIGTKNPFKAMAFKD